MCSKSAAPDPTRTVSLALVFLQARVPLSIAMTIQVSQHTTIIIRNPVHVPVSPPLLHNKALQQQRRMRTQRARTQGPWAGASPSPILHPLPVLITRAPACRRPVWVSVVHRPQGSYGYTSTSRASHSSQS
ncbi:hypothetical protein B0H19DRAFT_85424 [Mycena capillaripes]|nr:hypothetical protein B0H19DRAFT_85424 [Mycena capillaripes]